MNVFLIDEVSEGLVYLDSQESAHAFRVLRLTADDPVVALDGLGTVYHCEVVDPNPKRGLLRVVSQVQVTPRSPAISIALAPTKSSDRFEWFVEKACELGVDQIIPVICERSERRKLNLDRTHKLIASACKQSMNPWFPRVHEPVSFKDYLQSVKPGLIAHCMSANKKAISDMDISARSEWSVLIGPEGDFTSKEIELALSLGWDAISLGANRLRTETAALYSLAALVLKSSSGTSFLEL